MSTVIWHDIECGTYREDLPLWRELAERCGGPVLDIGAGTGRVSLALARAGHEVVALDRDASLLAELARRARGLPVRTVTADARAFALRDGERFPLVLVPMQTIQLLGGIDGRAGFLASARAHLAPGGRVAIAIAVDFEEFECADGDAGPLPDIQELEGVLYSSLPTAVRRRGSVVVLERRRETVDPRGARAVDNDRIHLDVVSALELSREGARAGLRPLELRRIAPTREHVGSEVVLLGG